MPRGVLSIVGFLLLLAGILSIILGMIGLRLRFLYFLDLLGPLSAFLIKLALIVIGIILMYTDNLRNGLEE